MSPYEILGIRPTASRDEAEAAYRALMRECHPDLHLHAGPEAVAWAEQRTRHLNAAIRAIRTEDRVFVGTAGEQFARDHGFRATDDTDWFGNPTRPRFNITCVMCGLQIEEQSEYRVHLLLDHAFAEQLRKHRLRAMRPPRLTMIPAPMFWALMLLMVYWACVFSIFGDSSAGLAGWWIGIVAYLIFLPFAYRAVRYRRRF
jgi:hypothetical protein